MGLEENMENKSDLFWEKCWKEENLEELYGYLKSYYKWSCKEMDIFKEHNVNVVCDAACGFGAYSLAFTSNGFIVHSFDISKTAVEITKAALNKYGINSSNVKVASILNTGYLDEMFDGVVGHAVLDHLIVSDAKKALDELFRITRKDGLIMVSFDNAEEDDFSLEHIILEDGSMQYTDCSREGMIFHPYEWEEIDRLLEGYNAIHKASNKREKIVILKK